MNSTTTINPGETMMMPRNPLAASGVSTLPQTRTRARNIAFGASVVAAPLGVGAAVGALTGSRKLGVIAGGASALALGLFRWQFVRWFTDEPAFTVERTIGDVEIRLYAPRVEAHTRFATLEFDEVRQRGFRRLAQYIFGANAAQHELAMTCPVTIAPRSRSHTVAFVMPPGISRSDLPHPDDSRIELVEVPSRRVAVLRYRGGYSARKVAQHATKLTQLVAEAGLTTRGEPIFAGFDPPTTLPFLRRTEIWLELA